METKKSTVWNHQDTRTRIFRSCSEDVLPFANNHQQPNEAAHMKHTVKLQPELKHRSEDANPQRGP